MRGRQAVKPKDVESGKDRKTFARDAGMGSVSFLSILAGTLVAFGSFAVLLAIVAGILSVVGVDTATLTANDYERLGIGGAVVTALVLFLSYFFGGYIAGRLARRAGALNGGLVLVLAILIGAAVALSVGTQTDTEAVAADLRLLGVPTSGSDYGTIATVAGILTLLAMIAGAVLGGIKGERWHGKLAARAFDPNVGPEGAARHEVVEAEHRRTERQGAPATEHDRSQRPWATQETAATQPQPQPEPVQSQPAQGQSVERDAPAPAPSRWSESETRAWGTPAGEGSAAPTSDQGDLITEEPAPRPRRERPLRGRRS